MRRLLPRLFPFSCECAVSLALPIGEAIVVAENYDDERLVRSVRNQFSTFQRRGVELRRALSAVARFSFTVVSIRVGRSMDNRRRSEIFCEEEQPGIPRFS